MAIMIKLRFVRHSARKLRPTLELFRGSKLEMAINKTAVMPSDSARILNKALKMAQAAAKDKQFDPADMTVSALFATDGPKIKRIRPNSRGRTNAYLKHLAHLTVEIQPGKDAKTVKPPKEAVTTQVRTKK